MKLEALLKNVGIEGSNESLNRNISSIQDDSRKLNPGDLFIAIKGDVVDGHYFIPDAISRGAEAVVYQDNVSLPPELANRVTLLKVENTRKALALIASNYYKNAHQKMKLVGVTGTNGKTTTCEFIYQLIIKSGKKSGLISTVSAKYSGSETNTGYHVTTPDALALHKLLSDMCESGCEYVVIETTSHGFDQHRTWGLEFEVGAVTNVTPEHLDYHKTFENYLKAKAHLFNQSKTVLLNHSDPSLAQLLKLMPEGKPYKIVDFAKMVVPLEFTTRFPGQYNLENLALARAVVLELTGIDTSSHFKDLERIKGRMEIIETGRNLKVIVDFAHDAASLEKALHVVKTLTSGQLVVVFGCAGLRDTQKRPKMGEIAVKLADKVVITAEDPRTENVKDIIKEIESGTVDAGVKINKDYFIVEDRKSAINFAINNLAKEGDVVLVTGKGHERSMCFGTIEVPWSDQEVVKEILAAKSSDNQATGIK